MKATLNISSSFDPLFIGSCNPLARLFKCCHPWLWLLLFTPMLAWSHTSETINSFSQTNYSGWIIASDASNASPGFNRDAILLNATVAYSNSSGTSQSIDYELRFSLRDENDNPVPVFNHLGISGPYYSVFDTISLATSTSLLRNYPLSGDIPLKPFGPLDPYQAYTLKLEVHEFVGGSPGVAPVVTAADNTPRLYSHFTSTNAADAEWNLITKAQTTYFTQRYIVDTDSNRQKFKAAVVYSLYRYDSYNHLPAASPPNDAIPIRFDIVLRDSNNTSLPLVTDQFSFTKLVPAYSFGGSPNRRPSSSTFSDTIEFELANPSSLDFNEDYTLEVIISHADNPATPASLSTGNSKITNPSPLRHLTGNLYFDSVQTELADVPFLLVPGTPAGSNENTLLIVGLNGGQMVGAPHTFGDGVSSLNVVLQPNGDALFVSNATTGGGVPLNSPASPDIFNLNGIEVERLGSLVLTASGINSGIRAKFPSGFGYTFAPKSKLLESWFEIPGTVALNSALEPTQSLFVFSPGGTFWVCEESQPYLLGIEAIDWDVTAGEFRLGASLGTNIQYVRRDELDYLDSVAGTLLNSDKNLKRSNEQYYRHLETFDISSVTLGIDPGNGHAQMTVDVTTKLPTGSPNQFTTHFPYDVTVRWTGAGQVQVDAGEIDKPNSFLSGASALSMDYHRDCGTLGCGAGIGPGTLTMTPAGGVLQLTEDGGLIADGSTSGTTDLKWGYIDSMGKFTQEARGFTAGTFHMAGHFLNGSSAPVDADKGTGFLHLTGMQPDGSASERPNTPAYLLGEAWYAGFNFNVPTSGANQGYSVFAGNDTIPPYDLDATAKYYARPGGVTGIHQAVVGAFNPPQLYGYPLSLDYYALSYRDTQNVDSRTEGNVAVPYPSQFDLDFKKLMLTCIGAVDSVQMAEGTEDKILNYWNADFTPLAMDFERNADDACDPGVGFLALGVSGWASHVTQPFFGTLGFKNDGNLITAADGLVDGRDSRLSGPTQLTFPGPNNETYTISLVSRLYYNNYDEAGGAEGFVSLAGAMDVPFFKDMKVQFHSRGDKDSNIAPIYLMGGWPDHGWTIGSETFFSQMPFDNDNIGFPSSVALDYYRNVNRSDESEQFLPRAQQSWLGVVNFDYPMTWSNFDRAFTSESRENRFLIVDVEHQVPYLSANSARMKFGAQWDGVPQLSLTNLAQSLIDDNVMRPFREAVDQGKDSMAQMLDDQVKKLFDPVFDELVDPLVDELYDALKEAYEDAAAAAGLPSNQALPFNDWKSAYDDLMLCYVTGSGAPPPGCPIDQNLVGLLQNISGGVDDVAGLIKEIDGHLIQAENIIDAFTSSFRDPEGRVLSDVDGLFVCDPNGDMNVALAEELIQRLLTTQDIGLNPAMIGRAIDQLLQPLLQDAKPTLKKIAEKLLKLREFIGQVRSVLAAGGEFVNNLQDELSSMTTTIQNVANEVDSRVQSFFNTLETFGALAGSPFEEYSKEEIKTLLRKEIEDAFYNSEIGTKLQVVVKQNLFDANGAICQAIDGVFGEINEVIYQILSSIFSDLDEKILPFLDKLNGIVGAGKLQGYAHIVGDAIRYARMDAELDWEVPKPMSFKGYIEIKQLNAEGSGNECYDGTPGVVNEVTIGAIDTPLNWISEGLRADVWGKTTFQTGSGFKLLGIGGGFEITEGEIKFEKFRITDLGAALALGKEETYLGARAHAVFDSVEVGIGAFFGRTCTLKPLEIVDADVASIIGTPPFTGAYLYGEAWIPVINYGCALRLTAGAGIGLGYFKEGPTYVGKIKLGISGEALCIVSVRGEFVLVGVKQGSEFRYKGTGEVTGRVGKCKWFCLKFKKSITVEK